MPVYDSRTVGEIPGPVKKIECLSGQAIVVDTTGGDPKTTTLNAGDTFDGGDKGGLSIVDTGGGGDIYVEYSLSPNAPINRENLQVVVGADNQPERSGFDDETSQRGVKDVMGVPGGVGIQDVTGNDITSEEGVLEKLKEGEAPTPSSTETQEFPEDAPEAHPAIKGPEVKGDEEPADDKQTGSYESRSKSSLYELAKERNLDVTSKSSKEDLVAALRGE